MRVLGNSPAALEGYLRSQRRTRRRRARPRSSASRSPSPSARSTAAATASAPTPCSAARPASAAEEILAASSSSATDSKSDAALKFARAVTLQRGTIADADLQAARAAGLNDAEIVEVVQHVALNILTNYTNNVAQTVIDFPEVKPGELEPETCTTEGCGMQPLTPLASESQSKKQSEL